MSRHPTTQYHHYIPQFLLRRFATAPTTVRINGRNQRRISADDKMVNAIDLTTDCPIIDTVPVRWIFGQQDMYRDVSKFAPEERMHMEKKLGKIESDASRLIARVIDAHTAGKDGISLSRAEKDIIRKFLFVMKYRSPIFFKRFNHQTADTYDSDDREDFLRYMSSRVSPRPLDVWFDNLLSIIDAPMDPAGEWITKLRTTIYPPDADWLFINIRTMHLAFVTPSNQCDEFILTGNAFGIHEGPVTFSVDRLTGKQTMRAYTEFHLINVISPRLAMVLRDNRLPEPLEDVDPDVRSRKKMMLAAQAQLHTDPKHATSLLEDLPVAKACNSYTIVKNGRLELAQGQDGTPRAGDKFDFVFFPLEPKHAQMINTVMLDQAHNTSMLIFKSRAALRTALEFYLGHAAQAKGEHSIKTITDRKDDPMLLLFRKLESVAQSLGSDVKAVYHIDPLDAVEIDDSDWQSDHKMELGINPCGVDHEQPVPENMRLADDEPDLDEAVAYALRTATPGPHVHPVWYVMSVLVMVLPKIGSNVRSMYAIDTMFEKDDKPTYPELVFRAVSAASPRNFNLHTKILLETDVELWKMCWSQLVAKALEGSRADTRADAEHLLENLRKLGAHDIADLPLEVQNVIEARSRGINRSDHKQPDSKSKNEAQMAKIYERRFENLVDAMGGDLTSPWKWRQESEMSATPFELLKLAKELVQIHNIQHDDQQAPSLPPHDATQNHTCKDHQLESSEKSDSYKALGSSQEWTASVLFALFLVLTWWYASWI
jgi:hypothetical protein